jgi:hypothetical protein
VEVEVKLHLVLIHKITVTPEVLVEEREFIRAQVQPMTVQPDIEAVFKLPNKAMQAEDLVQVILH